METLSELSCNLQLEPVHQLAPYLRNLNEADFCQELDQLADLVLSSSSDSFFEFDQQAQHYQQQQQQQQQHFEPSDGAYASPQTTIASTFYGSIAPYSACSSSWSACSSPRAPSDKQSVQPQQHSDYGSFYSSSSSSLYSSYPASLASSFCDDESQSSCGESSSSSLLVSRKKLARRTPGTGSSEQGPTRKRKNASAAERYRRKLKGHRFSLVEELEREQERNSSLREQINAKLALYSEFVSLLARNTSDNDQELAYLGAESLQEVLKNVIGESARGSQGLAVSKQLECHLSRFLTICGYQTR